MRDVLIGQTDYTIVVGIFGTDGAPETGLAYTDIDIDYTRVETDNDVTYDDVSPATLANLTAAHSDWGFIEIGQGLYRLDIADAVFAAGAWEAVVTISDASGTDFQPVHVGFRLKGQDGLVCTRKSAGNAATHYTTATNTNAARGTQIAAAQSAAAAGDRIEIVADATGNSIIGSVDGVTWHVPAGVTIYADEDYQHLLITDGASAISMKILGAGNFVATEEQLVAGFNGESDVYFEFDRIHVAATTYLTYPANCIIVGGTGGGGTYHFKGRELYSGNYDAIAVDGQYGSFSLNLEVDVITGEDSAIEIANTTDGFKARCVGKICRSLHPPSGIFQYDAAIMLPVTNNKTEMYFEYDVIECNGGRAVQQSTMDTSTGLPKITLKCPRINGNVEAAYLNLEGSGVIDSSDAALPSLKLAGSNVVLKGDWELITKSSETYSITADSAQTLTVIGTLKYNKAVHANVTINYVNPGVDWSNITNQTTTQNLSATTIKTATDVETAVAAVPDAVAAQADIAGMIAAVESLVSFGTGARTVTITVNDGSTALQGAYVRYSQAGNTTHFAQTNASGQVTFNCDDGTYTVAISKSGYSFSGTTQVVDGNETPTYSMTAIVITPAADPTQTTATLTTRNGKGDIKGSVTIGFRLVRGPGTAGHNYDAAQFTATSNAITGVLSVTLLRSAKYVGIRGDGREFEFTTEDASTYTLPEALGVDAS